MACTPVQSRAKSTRIETSGRPIPRATDPMGVSAPLVRRSEGPIPSVVCPDPPERGARGVRAEGISAGRCRQPKQPRRIEHSVVVGHDGFEIVGDGQRRRKMDGVERPEHLRFQHAGRVQNPVVDPDGSARLEEQAPPGSWVSARPF